MKGERTIDDIPFRYGGISHDFEKTSEEWAEFIPEMRTCYICGGKMRNVYNRSGSTLLKKSYPYAAFFRITKGKDKGKMKLRCMCRACAYDFGKGVIEMDGYTYRNLYDFKESRFKESLRRGICANCKHLKRHNGGLAMFVCDVRGAAVKDTRIRECDGMWESRKHDVQG